MPALTRRRSKGRHAESWQIFYGDVQVGTIGIRAGVPVDVDQWCWSCGFYPGSEPGEYLSGTAPTFDQARADFGKAWPWINGPFLFKEGGTPEEYGAALDYAIAKGWLWKHESGTYVMFTQAGAELFA